MTTALGRSIAWLIVVGVIGIVLHVLVHHPVSAVLALLVVVAVERWAGKRDRRHRPEEDPPEVTEALRWHCAATLDHCHRQDHTTAVKGVA